MWSFVSCSAAHLQSTGQDDSVDRLRFQAKSMVLAMKASHTIRRRVILYRRGRLDLVEPSPSPHAFCRQRANCRDQQSCQTCHPACAERNAYLLDVVQSVHACSLVSSSLSSSTLLSFKSDFVFRRSRGWVFAEPRTPAGQLEGAARPQTSGTSRPRSAHKRPIKPKIGCERLKDRPNDRQEPVARVVMVPAWLGLALTLGKGSQIEIQRALNLGSSSSPSHSQAF